jgi:hypothetical protein
MQLRVTNPGLYRRWLDAVRRFEGIQACVHGGGRFPLSAIGRLNSAPLFTELALQLLSPSGRLGLVVPSGIATDSFSQHLFGKMIDSSALISIYDFENRAGLFAAVHSSLKFSLLTCGSTNTPTHRAARFAFFAHDIDDLQDPKRSFILTPDEIALLNPNTKTCSVFRASTDAYLTRAIYRLVPILQRESGGPVTDPWGFVSRLLVMSNTDSELFESHSDLLGKGFTASGPFLLSGSDKYAPLYEAKMFELYDHRAADVVISERALKRQAQPRELSPEEHGDPSRYPRPRFWMRSADANEVYKDYSRGWYVAVTKVTSATNGRRFVAGLLPRFPCTDSGFAMFLTGADASALASGCFYACVCAYVFDYVARQKLGGVNMLGFIQKQLAVLPPTTYTKPCQWGSGVESIAAWIIPRVVELTYTAWDLEAFAKDCGFECAPFRWDEARRFLLRCELDAAFFHLYLCSDASGEWCHCEAESQEELQRLKASFPTPRLAVEYMMETFPIVKKRDVEEFGDYRTKLQVLATYGQMAEAMKTGVTYKTLLDPPPADSRCCHRAKHGIQD